MPLTQPGIVFSQECQCTQPQFDHNHGQLQSIKMCSCKPYLSDVKAGCGSLVDGALALAEEHVAPLQHACSAPYSNMTNAQFAQHCNVYGGLA